MGFVELKSEFDKVHLKIKEANLYQPNAHDFIASNLVKAHLIKHYQICTVFGNSY